MHISTLAVCNAPIKMFISFFTLHLFGSFVRAAHPQIIPAEYSLNKKGKTHRENGDGPPTVCTNSPMGNTRQRASGGGDASRATSDAPPDCLSFQQGDFKFWQPTPLRYLTHVPWPPVPQFIFYQMLAEPEGVASLCAHLVMAVKFSTTALGKKTGSLETWGQAKTASSQTEQNWQCGDTIKLCSPTAFCWAPVCTNSKASYPNSWQLCVQ